MQKQAVTKVTACAIIFQLNNTLRRTFSFHLYHIDFFLHMFHNYKFIVLFYCAFVNP